jgi:hypothetical protein
MTSIDLRARYYKLSPPERFDGHQTVDQRVDLNGAAMLVVDVYGLSFSADERHVRSHPSKNAATTVPWDTIATEAIQPALDAARRAQQRSADRAQPLADRDHVEPQPRL